MGGPLLARALAVFALAGVGCQGCAELHEVAAATRSTGAFAPTSDPRVFAEPGTAALAAATASAVPGAIRRVEDALGGPFTIPVRVYVCATLDSYDRFTRSGRSGGHTTIAKKIFISPKPENTPERIPAVVAHELTHLHGYSRGQTASSFGLPAHLFYRQAAMFIGYLKDRDASAFRRFLAGVEEHLVVADARQARGRAVGSRRHARALITG